MSKLAISGGKRVREKGFPKWPVYGEEDKSALLAVLESRKWGTLGPRVQEFQEKFAAFTETRHGLCVSNGSVSLEIALRAMGIGPGDEVIVPPYTFVATASSVLAAGATPVFADIDINNFNCINPSVMEAAITARTKAIIPVHMAGCPADMDPIMGLAEKFGLYVLEDAAQAHGAEYKGHKVGSIGHAASFSFQESKNLSAGEGGFLTTNSKELWEKCWTVHNTGRVPGGAWYQHEFPGSNHRMTEWQAAILLGQLTRLPEQMKKRESSARLLYSSLEGLEGIILFPLQDDFTYAWHLFMFRLEEQLVKKVGKRNFAGALTAEGIPTEAGYVNLAGQKLFGTEMVQRVLNRPIDYGKLSLPVTERACASTLWFSQNMLLGDEADIADIAEGVRKVIENVGELT
jgi:dTDP-4-amino-4,6-dideoxygalactose transaminase